MATLKNRFFRPGSSLRSKFYPRNINYMSAVKFFACLDLERKTEFFKAPSYYEPINDLFKFIGHFKKIGAAVINPGTVAGNLIGC